MNRKLSLLFGCLWTATLLGQYIPPDYYQEKYMPSIGFWANNGQVIGTDGNKPADVRFYTTGSVPQVYLRTKSKVSFALHVADTIMSTVDTIYHLQMQPWGANAAQNDPIGTVLKDSHLNYHLPHCGAAGVTGVAGYSRVLYEEIFPYVDLHFYSGGFGQKMALVCRPGADLDDIKLRFTGQDSLNQDLWGNLRFYHDGRYFVLPHAVAYQVNTDDTTIPIGWNAGYEADGDAGTVTFQWEAYDSTKSLVFLIGPPPAMGDQVNTPGVCWSTYLGGDGGDRIYASDTDQEGNYYVGGYTYSQAINFPIGLGMVTFEASPIAFVSKFGTGYESRWSTFYGGSTGIQWVRGLAVRSGLDPSIVIGGRTDANDLWPMDPGDGSYFDGTTTDGGGFLAELDNEGVAIWSTYFGNGSISVLNIDLHANGSIGVCGDTHGTLPPEQDPAPPLAEHWSYAGNGDGWVALLKPERRTYWTTWIGGTANDYLKSVRFGDEKVVFAGLSESTNFPLKDGGSIAHDEANAGGYDITISEFTMDGELSWSTYLGGSGGEQPGYQGLVVRPSDLGTEDIFVVGYTSSTDLPFEPGPGWHIDTLEPFTGISGYIARFHGTNRSRLWLTYVNGGTINFGETLLEAVTLDRADRLFVGGYTLTDGFPFQPAWELYSTYVEYGAWDGVLMCFSPDQELVWSTRFGGDENGTQGDRIETLCTWSDKRFFAGGITYASFNDQSFFPFTDPIGDTDYFDGLFYPQWDSFVAAFCTHELLTAVQATVPTQRLAATMVAPGIFELTGLPLSRSLIQVVDATGRIVQKAVTVGNGTHLRIDLTAKATGVYVVYVVGVGSLRLYNGQ